MGSVVVTAEDITALGYFGVKRAKSGEWLGVQKMLYTTGLFVIHEDGSAWRTRFCYEHSIDAVLALAAWDGEGDPPGPWVKEKPSDRHGPGMAPFLKRGTHDQGPPEETDADLFGAGAQPRRADQG